SRSSFQRGSAASPSDGCPSKRRHLVPGSDPMDGPVFTLFAISISQAVAGSLTKGTLTLYGLGVPFVVAGLLSAFKLFGKINDDTFRTSVLVLLLLCELSLVILALVSGFGPLMLDFFGPSAPPI